MKWVGELADRCGSKSEVCDTITQIDTGELFGANLTKDHHLVLLIELVRFHDVLERAMSGSRAHDRTKQEFAKRLELMLDVIEFCDEKQAEEAGDAPASSALRAWSKMWTAEKDLVSSDGSLPGNLDNVLSALRACSVEKAINQKFREILSFERSLDRCLMSTATELKYLIPPASNDLL